MNRDQAKGWRAGDTCLPVYHINEDGALAEWSWPTLVDRYNHRQISHLYPAWPLHEINPDEEPTLTIAARWALELRGEEHGKAHGILHTA